MGFLIQREGIDLDPVKPWQWADLAGWVGPVEIVSFPVPAEGHGAVIDEAATIMIRLHVGQPGTLEEVPFSDVKVYAPERHPWFKRPRKYSIDNPTAFYFTDDAGA